MYLDKWTNGVDFIQIFDDFGLIFIVAFDENSGVGLVQLHLPPKHRHQLLVAHLHDLDELGEDGMAVDGDHLGKKIPLPFLPICSCQNFLASHLGTDWLSWLGLGNQVGSTTDHPELLPTQHTKKSKND